MKNLIFTVCALLFTLLFAYAYAEPRTITAYTEVEKWGQMPQYFEISHQTLPEEVKPDDFIIEGEAAGWNTETRHPFSVAVKSVEVTGDGWRLYPDRFPDKYFYVRNMTVTCAKHPDLSFTLEDITETVTPVADDFIWIENKEKRLSAHLFKPEADTLLPLVIVFHGYGDTENLLTYRTAVHWAEPDQQAAHPCVVLAPVIESALYFSDPARTKICRAVMEYVDEMAAEGIVDPNRIYLTGNSFGGMTSLEMAEEYPDRIAAVLALCPALNYSKTGMARLPELTDTPIWIAQAENDETISSTVGKKAAQVLQEAGNEHVQLKIYSDEEMEAHGATHGSEQTYSFHHVELAVLEDESYSEWLFSNRLSD